MFLLNMVFDYIVTVLPMVRAGEDANINMLDPKAFFEYIQADSIVKESRK